jgi:hypothetical protein
MMKITQRQNEKAGKQICRCYEDGTTVKEGRVVLSNGFVQTFSISASRE